MTMRYLCKGKQLGDGKEVMGYYWCIDEHYNPEFGLKFVNWNGEEEGKEMVEFVRLSEVRAIEIFTNEEVRNEIKHDS